MNPNTEISQERRKRKKKLYNDIKEQMEFYFSDSNLMRDKFLLDLLDQTEDGFIDLEVFVTFNKIRALTTNLNEIIKAISSSEILQVNQEKTKIRRATEINLPANVDDSTVYVENFPPNCNHDWFKNVFSSFGEVTYVSLPKHKTTKKNKGFAFVEFSNSDATQRACVYFGGVSSVRETPTENRVEPVKNESIKCDVIIPTDESQRKTADDVIKPITVEEFEPVQEIPEENYMSKRQKKRRRRKKKSKESEVLNLYIVSKNEWKQLKMKYLALQKENMAQIKRSLGIESKLKESFQEEKVEEKTIHSPDFIPGVIIKLTLNSPLSNVKLFKDNVLATEKVAFVDSKTNVEFVYVRCFRVEDSRFMMMSDLLLENGKCEILKGEEESDYWRKISDDRAEKQKTKTRPKKRGRDKIISRAETLLSGPKHIRFNDD